MNWRCAPARAAALALLCAAPAAAAGPKAVSLKTADGWTLSATYRAPRAAMPAVVLVHGVGAGKGEWDDLAAALQKRGIGSLAVDLRGHGDSLAGPSGRQTYQSFSSSQDWLDAQKDVAAAVAYLSRRVERDRIVLIGGSIGANLCARAAVELKMRSVALLSPGRDYRGVALPDLSGLKVLAAASPADGYAFSTVAELSRLPNVAVLQADSGHGAQMLRDPEFVNKLIAWIAASAR